MQSLSWSSFGKSAIFIRRYRLVDVAAAGYYVPGSSPQRRRADRFVNLSNRCAYEKVTISLPDIEEVTINEKNVVRFEFFTAVTMRNGVFWNVKRCGSCKSRCFGGT
jgi:hypothetical protein